ncbi:hypothetical protein PTE30175_04815 [Pandoraea terrae]|uniref:Phytanoyl-CoA dioxygenase n=1 Tax=Pandoraea terrae TaxID=1537710 RepID=A0A5E4Z2C1_9BURK|nr:phytanoyl-CoA dioxygenase family protein [Pandoraea terrae]VVE54283.1 hypothetical protein PTE30175_04815 [Pandoraea terrae]
MQVTEQMKQDLAVNGAIVIRGLFSPEQMKRARECFDYAIAHPGTGKIIFEGTSDAHYNEYGNPANRDMYLAFVREVGLQDLFASLWDSEHVWFITEELFIKSGGKAGGSPWHQDTSVIPANGPHVANLWFSFESLPKENSLEIVRGSHLGPEYDAPAYVDPSDPTAPGWGGDFFQKLPDIEADRKNDPTSWDVISWDLEPGDALVFHSGALHGGAPVTPACPTRHTMALRFTGDKLFYRALPPVESDYQMEFGGANDPSLNPGDPYHPSHFTQLR